MIRSFRFGFATNSSSSHSVILHPNPEAARRYPPSSPWGQGISPDHPDNYSLTTAKDKAGYLAHSMARSRAWKATTAHEQARIAHAFQTAGFPLSELLAVDPAIEMAIVQAQCPEGVPLHLWLSFLLDPSVTLHVRPEGGAEDAMYDPCLEIGHMRVPYPDSTFTRWKVDGEALIGFDRFDGSKFRWSPTPYEKSTVPELVDVKITDWCGFGCAFCYQGSTEQGAHAPLERILSIFRDLADMGVFEVALGGGEPLSHPDIAAILKGGTEMGLSVALTTYDKGFATRPDAQDLFKRDYQDGHGFVAATGISVHGPRDVRHLAESREALRKQEIYMELVAQTVVGATPMATLERTLDLAIENETPLLLLGYKTTGRGAGRERPINRDALRKILRKAARARTMPEVLSSDSGFRLGVDTAFLDAHGDLLDEIGIPALLRSSPEGKFSMYIDAVANTCGPSSYCETGHMQPLGDLRAQFAQW